MLGQIIKTLKSNDIRGVYQFRTEDKKAHLLAFTGRRIVEIDFDGKEIQPIATSKAIKKTKLKSEIFSGKA